MFAPPTAIYTHGPGLRHVHCITDMGELDWYYSACEIMAFQPIATKVTKVIFSNTTL